MPVQPLFHCRPIRLRCCLRPRCTEDGDIVICRKCGYELPCASTFRPERWRAIVRTDKNSETLAPMDTDIRHVILQQTGASRGPSPTPAISTLPDASPPAPAVRCGRPIRRPVIRIETQRFAQTQGAGQTRSHPVRTACGLEIADQQRGQTHARLAISSVRPTDPST